MKIINVIQGTDEWKSFRADHCTASEAPAMMGDSKYTGRNQLLHEKKTGVSKIVDARTQSRFDDGHAAEASIRPHIEEIVGGDLYPVTGVSDEHPELLASFDGITMLGDIVFEHKLWNDALAENIRNNVIEPHYYWQLEQQLLVSGAKKAIFVTSDGTPDKMEYMWYEPVPGRAEELLAGWEQFGRDLAEYVPEAKQEVITATQSVALPALTARVEGSLVVSNIGDCLPQLRTMAESEVNKKLETDLDFANKELLIKSVKTAREKLKTLTETTISNFESLQEFKDAASEADSILQKVQSHGEKQIKSRKDEIKAEIISTASATLNQHVEQINSRFDGILLPPISVDFAGSIKGKRNIQSMKEAVSDELAKAKIEANRYAVKIEDNLKALEFEAEDYSFLFNDLQQIIMKDHSDFINLVKLRVAEHKAAEEKRKAQDEANKVALECAQASKVDTTEVVKHPPHANTQINGSVSARNVSINKTLAEALGDWCTLNGIDSCAVGDLFQLLSIYHIDLSVQKAA